MSTTFFGKRDEGHVSHRKFLRILSMLSTLQVNPIDGKNFLGRKDPKEQDDLLHDSILHQCVQIDMILQSKTEPLSKVQARFNQINKVISLYPECDLSKFNPLIEYFERELKNYERRSFASRIFKK